MIRIKPTRRFRVSNRLALIGAITLTLTLFTGMDGWQTNAPEVTDQATAMVHQAEEMNDSSDPAERRKRFSISRLLFGHG